MSEPASKTSAEIISDEVVADLLNNPHDPEESDESVLSDPAEIFVEEELESEPEVEEVPQKSCEKISDEVVDELLNTPADLEESEEARRRLIQALLDSERELEIEKARNEIIMEAVRGQESRVSMDVESLQDEKAYRESLEEFKAARDKLLEVQTLGVAEVESLRQECEFLRGERQRSKAQFEEEVLKFGLKLKSSQTRQPLTEKSLKILLRRLSNTDELLLEASKEYERYSEEVRELEKELEKLECSFEGFSFTEFEALRTEVAALENQLEEKGVEQRRMRTRLEGKTEYLAHRREKLEVIQEQNADQFVKVLTENEKFEAAREGVRKTMKEVKRKRHEKREATLSLGIAAKPGLLEHFLATEEQIGDLGREERGTLEAERRQMEELLQ